MDVTVTVIGASEIAADLDKIARELPGLMVDAVTKVAADVDRGAREQIVSMGAVDTGTMLNSVTHEVHATGDGAEARVGTGVDYARYVHDSTYKMPGRPFMDAPTMAGAEQLHAALEAVLRL